MYSVSMGSFCGYLYSFYFSHIFSQCKHPVVFIYHLALALEFVSVKQIMQRVKLSNENTQKDQMSVMFMLCRYQVQSTRP